MKKGYLKLLLMIISFGLQFPLFGQKQWSLKECIDYAWENNLNVQQAGIRNQLTETQIRAAKNQRLPDLNGFINNQFILGLSNVPITNSNQQIVGAETRGFQQYQNSFGISSQIILYNGGQINLNEERALIDFEAAKLSTEDIKNDIALQIANGYLSILLNKELLRVSEEQLEISNIQLEQNQKLYEAGAVALSQIAELKAQRAQDVQNVANAKINVQQALFDLSQLLQLEDYQQFEVQDVSTDFAVEQGLYDLEEIQNYAIQNQPQIKQRQMELEVDQTDIDLAKAAYKPTVTGSYQFSTFYNTILDRQITSDPLFDQWYENQNHVFAVGVSIPIFNRYQTDLQVQQAEISKSISQKTLDLEKQTLKQEIQMAYFNLNTTYEQYQAADEAVKTSELALDFAKKSLDAGRITIYDFNQTRNNYLISLSQMLQAKYNYLFRKKVLEFYAGIPLEL